MRWVFWLLGLFALAVAVALGLRFNSGYVLLVSPPYRVELSLNLFLLAALAALGAGYLLLRFLLGAIELPARVREFRARRRREQTRNELIEALRAFFEGRYGRAEKAAATVIESDDLPALGAVLAARAAHELRAYDRRDEYLARAGERAPADTAMRVIAEAELLLGQHRFQEALLALKALPHKHTAGLRLELRAQQQAKNWEQTLPLIDQLTRRGVFDAAQAAQLRRYAQIESVRRRALDPYSLEDYWQKVPAEQKRDPKVAAAAAQAFTLLGGGERAARIIEEALDREWDSELAGCYAECSGAPVVRRIERAEKWLAANPRDSALLLTLGRLCAEQQLWGKAQSYLDASVAVEPTWSAHLALADLHDQLGHAEAARRHTRQSLELAVAQLKQMTGGRRRVPL
jgi:HemY protein